MSEALKVLYVHNSADLYGASRSLVRLLKKLDRDQFKPIVLLPSDGPLREQVEATGTEVIIHQRLTVIERSALSLPKLPALILGFPISTWFIRNLIRQHRIDLVHTNTGVMPSPGLAAKLTGVAHVWHIRDWFQEFHSFWKYYERYIRWCSITIVTVSEAIAKQFRNREKVRVIHNGFSLEEFQLDRAAIGKDFREKWRIEDSLTIGCVGRIKLVRKGQEILLQALPEVIRVAPNLKCLIVGTVFEGNESHLDELKAIAVKLKIEDHVVFTGELSDPKPAYAAMDIFVLPSAQPEPFGGVVMEAMSIGLPVIATAIGGSVDQVVNDTTGYLVPPSDPKALAERLIQLAQDRSIREQMGNAARQRIANSFSIDDKVKELQSVYQRSIDGGA